jgi:hypothetical protein
MVEEVLQGYPAASADWVQVEITTDGVENALSVPD